MIALLLLLLAATSLAAPLKPALVVPSTVIPLAVFDGSSSPAAKHQWYVTNDPVMGGLSRSTFVIDHSTSTMNWTGVVRVVPSLSAPGFCNLETTNQLTDKYADVSSTTHLVLRVRTSTPQYTGFKVSFAANTVNPQFKSFKADFSVGLNNTWVDVTIPFTDFSNDWSPFTGSCTTLDPTGVQHHCCTPETPSVCVTHSDLTKITALGIWAEGVADSFQLDVAYIGATNVSAPAGHSLTCHGPVQSNLRYNISNRLASDYLPFGGEYPNEDLVTGLCCDAAFVTYSEPQGFYALPDINLFAHMQPGTVTVFYDPICGLPLFQAPINRTLADFFADTTEHTWPSFRPGEVFLENVLIQDSGHMYSVCGTHLGDYAPDSQGDRYCIDLTCISGNP